MQRSDDKAVSSPGVGWCSPASPHTQLEWSSVGYNQSPPLGVLSLSHGGPQQQ